jgi:cytochrome c biogenesis protein CcdA
LHALTVADETAAFYAFVTAAITIALVMAILVVAIGSAQAYVVRTMKGSTRSVKRWGGAVLMIVGIWLIVLAVWAKTFAQIFPI